jgi:hypothetical protein
MNHAQIASNKNKLLYCLYQNKTDQLIGEVDISTLRQACTQKVKLVENIIKTVVVPVLTIGIICIVSGVLCFRLRWQIWWEYNVIHNKRQYNDIKEFKHNIFIGCEDSRNAGEFVRRLQETTSEHINSSKDISYNNNELEENGRMLDCSRRVLFLVDDAFMNNLRHWQFLIPPVIASRHLDNIALLLHTGVMESSLSEYYPLWRLSKSRQCLGFYNGQDTNTDVWRRTVEFVNSHDASCNDRLRDYDHENMELFRTGSDLHVLQRD